ncbi:hypothetical protein PR048_008082 [Dryococelus australis]|uniref:Uncharacterized protein n=1 Tax=Dryococelus australis TaxID=614101 RepID=A0ABQ9HW88_9NEOP|nr:hypothetical protein PR048_008082 [Dryococelus australis]
MVEYTFAEYTDMIIVYGAAEDNGSSSAVSRALSATCDTIAYPFCHSYTRSHGTIRGRYFEARGVAMPVKRGARGEGVRGKPRAAASGKNIIVPGRSRAGSLPFKADTVLETSVSTRKTSRWISNPCPQDNNEQQKLEFLKKFAFDMNGRWRNQTISTVGLLASYQGEPDSIPGRFSPDFRKWESCRTMPLVGGFSLDLPFPLPIFAGAAPYSPRITLIGSQDLAVKSGPNLFTHSEAVKTSPTPSPTRPASNAPYYSRRKHEKSGHYGCLLRLRRHINKEHLRECSRSSDIGDQIHVVLAHDTLHFPALVVIQSTATDNTPQLLGGMCKRPSIDASEHVPEFPDKHCTINTISYDYLLHRGWLSPQIPRARALGRIDSETEWEEECSSAGLRIGRRRKVWNFRLVISSHFAIQVTQMCEEGRRFSSSTDITIMETQAPKPIKIILDTFWRESDEGKAPGDCCQSKVLWSACKQNYIAVAVVSGPPSCFDTYRLSGINGSGVPNFTYLRAEQVAYTKANGTGMPCGERLHIGHHNAEISSDKLQTVRRQVHQLSALHVEATPLYIRRSASTVVLYRRISPRSRKHTPR